MPQSSRFCPKCQQPLTVPQPAPEKIHCAKCGATIRIDSARRDRGETSAPATPVPLTSAAALLEALRKYRILDAAQLEQLAGTLPGRALDARALAQELMQRGSLTAFQVNKLLPGRGAELVLGEYLLLERLGEGSMGQVFKARHQRMGRLVAIKVIRNELLAHPDARQRFDREIRLVAQLDHPHLVRAHDAAQIGGTHFLVMEYAEGTDLQRLVQKDGPLPVAQASEYIRQAALGLQNALEHGMVHRDVKPSNIQVTAQGRLVKILDMGLARSQAAEGETRNELTQARTVMGTPDYIAPEQVADARNVDIRADIYSLGCTFYYLLAGQPPFPNGDWQEKLTQHRTVEPQPIEQVCPEVPAALGTVLRKMMAKRPEDRYARPDAVANALLVFCQTAVPALVAARVGGGAADMGSLLSQPAAAPEAGWTLPMGSTLNTPPVASTPSHASAAPDIFERKTVLVSSPLALANLPALSPSNSSAGGTILAPVPQSQSTPTPPRRFNWLLAALAGTLLIGMVSVVLAAVAVGVWFSSHAPGKDKDKDKVEVAAAKSPYPPPPPDPVLEGVKDGQPLKMSLKDPYYPPTCVAFMPDGKRGVVRDYAGQYVKIFDLVDGVSRPKEPLSPHFLQEAIYPALVISPDGKRFLVPSNMKVDRRNGETYVEENPAIGLSGQCTAVAFSPDSKIVATAERDGNGGIIRFWGAKEREPLKNEIRVKSPVLALSFSPDGRFLVVSSGGLADMSLVHASNEKITIYRYEDGEPVTVLPGHEKSACWAGYLADGKRLFSASPFDGTLRVWDIEEKREVMKIEAGKSATGLTSIQDAKDPKYMVCCAFWPWGRALTAHRDGSLKLWDLDSGKLIEPPGRIDSLSLVAQKFPTAMAFSPGGGYALVAYNDEFLYLLRLPPPKFGKSP